jgi:hypothetical protein
VCKESLLIVFSAAYMWPVTINERTLSISLPLQAEAHVAPASCGM